MSGIFISYRRSDAQGEALHLFDDLKEHFGADLIFMDVATIGIGKDFRTAIEEAVSSCDVLISIIGAKWAQTEKPEDEVDFVHLETVIALRRDIPVVPVLVQGAAPPSAKQLPADLEPLAWRNAFELRHTRWDSDVEDLKRALGNVPGLAAASADARRRRAPDRPDPPPPPHRPHDPPPPGRVSPSAKKLALAVGAGGAVAVLAFVLATAPRPGAGDDPAPLASSFRPQSPAEPASQRTPPGRSRAAAGSGAAIVPAGQQDAAETRITLQYQTPGDRDNLLNVYRTLQLRDGWRVDLPERVLPQGENIPETYGGVRYYFAEDSTRARIVCEAVVATLARQGYTVMLPLWPMTTGQQQGLFHARRGLIEVWISPLPERPLEPALRPRVGRCGG
jgi:hypothetical protein